MSCRNARLMMSARLDNDITPEDERRLEEHITDCPQCDRFWQAMYAAGSVVREEVPVFLKHDFTDRVMSCIEALASPVLQPPAWRKWTALVTVVSLVFAITVAPTVAALLIWQFNPGFLTGIGSWYTSVGQFLGYWLSAAVGQWQILMDSAVQVLMGGGGVVALGGVLVLTGAFLTSYMAIWTRYQATVTRA